MLAGAVDDGRTGGVVGAEVGQGSGALLGAMQHKRRAWLRLRDMVLEVPGDALARGGVACASSLLSEGLHCYVEERVGVRVLCAMGWGLMGQVPEVRGWAAWQSTAAWVA